MDMEWLGDIFEKIFEPIIIALAAIFTVLFLIVLVKFFFFTPSNETLYNNGICSECNAGRYEYSEAVGHQLGSTYIYTCDNCGHKIEISELK